MKWQKLVLNNIVNKCRSNNNSKIVFINKFIVIVINYFNDVLDKTLDFICNNNIHTLSTHLHKKN